MYDPVVEGKHLTFDVLGLVQDVFTMTDRETGTVWNHLDGRAVRGPLEGKRLTMVPAPQMTWGEWRDSHPDTVILSPDAPFQSRYRSVRIGAFNPSEALFGDDRLAANALVVGVEVEERFKGYTHLARALSCGTRRRIPYGTIRVGPSLGPWQEPPWSLCHPLFLSGMAGQLTIQRRCCLEHNPNRQ